MIPPAIRNSRDGIDQRARIAGSPFVFTGCSFFFAFFLLKGKVKSVYDEFCHLIAQNQVGWAIKRRRRRAAGNDSEVIESFYVRAEGV